MGRLGVFEVIVRFLVWDSDTWQMLRTVFSPLPSQSSILPIIFSQCRIWAYRSAQLPPGPFLSNSVAMR